MLRNSYGLPIAILTLLLLPLSAISAPPAALPPSAPKPAAKPAVLAPKITKQIAVAPTPKAPQRPNTPTVIPDYGGRDGVVAPASVAGAGQTMDPLGQAWRAFEALAIVLIGIVLVLYLIKRFGGGTLGMPGRLAGLSIFARPTASNKFGASSDEFAITLLNSQILPGGQGAALHVVAINGRTLVLGVTAQSVHVVTEWSEPKDRVVQSDQETASEKSEFSHYLERAGIAQEPEKLELNVENRFAATNDRLQTLLRKSREDMDTDAWKSDKA